MTLADLFVLRGTPDLTRSGNGREFIIHGTEERVSMEHSRFGRCKIAVALLVLVAVPIRAQTIFSSQTGEKLTLKSCVNQFSPTHAESTKVGYQYWFIDKDFLDGRTVKMSVVKAHAATHAPHRHTEDEIFFVLEGNAEVFLNGETMVLHPYATFYCPSNSEHGMRNVGDAELKYLVLKKIEKK